MALKRTQRRNAFDDWGRQVEPEEALPGDYALPRPPSPLDLIPAAEPRRRNRGWEGRHRAWSYKIPGHLRQKAMEVRAAILGIALLGPTTADDVARALISLALDHVESGKWMIEARPDPRRLKMKVVWEESSGLWPQATPPPQKRIKKRKDDRRDFYLAYRWSDSIHQKICHISGDSLARGEVVVVLLHHGLEAYRGGKIRLVFQPKTTTQAEEL